MHAINAIAAKARLIHLSTSLAPKAPFLPSFSVNNNSSINIPPSFLIPKCIPLINHHHHRQEASLIMEDHEQYETLSLRARRKKPSVSLSCCFNGHHHSFDATSSSIMPSPNSRMSPSSLKGRYKNLISRMSRHRRHSSADFSYDPLSYSLNFEDAAHHHDDPADVDDFPIRSFAARLPLSPPGSGRPTFIPPPYSSSSAARKTTNPMQHRTPCTSRAAAVAEVRKSLEEANPREARKSMESPPNPWKLEEMRSRDISTPTPRKVKTTVPESRRNIDLLTPRAAAEVRRSYDYDEVSPALVVSPTSRQVLVELC